MSVVKQQTRARKQLTMRARREIYGYLFIAPFVIGFLVFLIQPLIDSLWMSLCDVQIDAQGIHPQFWGFTNYNKAFNIDPDFRRMMTYEVGRKETHTLDIQEVSLVIAIILNKEFKGRAFVRAVFFLPVILSSGVLVGLENNNSLMSSIQNMVQANASVHLSDSMVRIIRLSGIGADVLDIVESLIGQVQSIVMSSGIQIIVFLTGLQGIPRSLYEAADVEGCTKWESFWKITFPMISPLLIVNIIYSVIDFFMRTDSNIMNKINTTMVVKMDYGFASAMAWVYFLIVIVMIAVSSLIVSRGVVRSYD